jgi:hypothetical protein
MAAADAERTKAARGTRTYFMTRAPAMDDEKINGGIAARSTRQM